MKQLLTGIEIANTVRMMRTQHSGSILIVEGEKDMSVYSHFVDDQNCKLTPSFGKPNAIIAIKTLEAESFAGVVSIIDCDFCRVDGILPSSPNLLVTDTHDLEGLILQSPALDKVMLEYGSKTKLNGKDVRAIIFKSCERVGILRWLSNKERLGLEFNELSFSKFVDKETLTVDTFKLIMVVKNKSKKHSLDAPPLKKKIENLVKVHDRAEMCCGHDLAQILSIGLLKMFGSCQVKDVRPENLERALRLAYEKSFFALTVLYKALKNWEKGNNPYIVLSW